MSDSSSRGRFVWYDLMTTDPDAAPKFYAAIAGWGTQQWSGANSAMPPYTMWTVGQTPIGGLMQLPDQAARMGAPPHWLAYIATTDVDATVKQAQKLGGKVLREPMDIPTVGRFAVLADPQGAVFAPFASSNAPGPDVPPKVGEFSWHELATTDHAKAFDFYTTLFGWERTNAMDMGEMGTYQMYGRDGKELGGMFNAPSGIPPHWLFYIMVDSADRVAKRVKELGGKVLNGPMDIPGGGRIAQCLDPQGAAFALHSAAEKA
jgi:predicted enzyme related to lactoylglutathione lyase